MKTKIYINITLITFIFGLVPLSSSAQWQWQNPYPTEHSLNAIQFLDQDNGWIVGNFGTILKTEDGGNTWEMRPQPDGSYHNLCCVHFTDPENGWAIGWWIMAGNKIFHTGDGGNTWEEQYTGGYGDASIFSLYFTDPDNGWAVGQYGTIMNTTNRGATWTSQVSGTSSTLDEVCFTDPDNGWAVGVSGTVFNTTNGGTTWTPQVSGTTSHLNDVCFIDPDNGWAVGNAGIILHTTNGGQLWTSQTTGSDDLNSICFADQYHGWIVGSQGTILHSSDGGLTWGLQTCPENQWLLDVFFTDQNNGFAVGSCGPWGEWGARLRTNDGGTTWISDDRISTTQNLHDVCFYDKDRGWASADSGYIVLTTDGGYTWEEQYTGSIYILYGISFIDEDIGWVAGNQGTIMKTEDGGITWSPQVSGTNASLYDICFTDPDNGWAVGRNSTILHTNDGGSNWVIDSIGGNLHLCSVCFVDHNNGWIADGYGTIIHTANGGITWEDQFSGPYLFKSIFFTDLNNGWVVGQGVLRTTDGGNTWITEYKSDPLIYTSCFESVYFTDPMNGWAVGWHTGGMFGSPSGDLLIYTNDGGINWESVSFPTANGLYGVAAIDPQNAWAVGDAGIIISTSDFTVDTNEEFPPYEDDRINNSGTLIVTIYPNPSSGKSDIRYQISRLRSASDGQAEIRNVILAVYDIHGQEIGVLINETQPAGEYTVQFDASDLPVGIYLIQLRVGNDVVTSKMVKINN